jgi:hypothetical protein
MEKNNLKEELLVKDILKKSTVEEPSGDFTDIVMRKVEQAKPAWSSAFQPIISRKAWVLIGISTVLVMALVIFAGMFIPEKGTGKFLLSTDFEHCIPYFNMYLNNFLTKLKIPFLFPLGIAFIFLMMGLDLLARKVLKL